MTIHVPNNFSVSVVAAPASKSYAQRAILAATLSDQWSEITNIGTSEDVQNILQVARQLGAQIEQVNNGVRIKGSRIPHNSELNCGESGLGTRLVTLIAAAIGGEFLITGHGSLLERPMAMFEKILPALGVEVVSNDGKLPLKIKGQLKGAKIEIEGSESSQYLSGLLMALPLAEESSWIKVNHLVSVGYIDMTLDVLSMFGIMIPNQDGVYFIDGGQKYQPADFVVEGDWSAAAFWVVYGALCQTILIKEINMFSSQADAAILEVLEIAGGQYEWLDDGLQIEPAKLKPFEVDATNCPDLFPVLTVLAAATNGESKIHGVNRLKHKESDRGIVLQREFGTLGLNIDIEDDTMTIHGTGQLKSGTVDSNNDHRIAMAVAIAAVLTPHGIEITSSEAVNKSYPGFWNEITGT